MFEALECAQKEKAFYMAFLSATVVDALSEVPAVPSMRYDELADRCRQGMTEWQRELSVSRAEDIGNWWANTGSFIVNAPVIAFRDELNVEVTRTPVGNLILATIRVPHWFAHECPSRERHTASSGRLFDRCPVHGCEFHTKVINQRPAIIIDGQHRIRGTQRGNASSIQMTLPTSVSLTVAEIPIPVAVLPSSGMYGFDRNQQAKLFTEITTKSEDLHYLHKLWLLYRFSMAARIPDLREMGENVSMELTTTRGKRTRDAYETILLLVGTTMGGSGAGNPWRGKVPIFREDSNQHSIATIDRLLPLAYEWFGTSGPFYGKLPGQAATELRDFLKAIVSSWDRPSPTSELYWHPPITPVPGAVDRGILSHSEGGGMTTWLRALMRIFPTVYQSVPQGTASPGIGHFKTALASVKECFFEGDGWDQIPGREVQEDLLYRVLNESVGVPNRGKVGAEMQAHGLASLNEYIKKPPLFVPPTLSSAGPPGRTGHPTIRDAQTKIEWQRPFSSFRRCKILITQETKATSKELRKNLDEHQAGELILDSSEDHFDPNLGGTRVTVRLQYENHMGPKTHAIELEVPSSRAGASATGRRTRRTRAGR